MFILFNYRIIFLRQFNNIVKSTSNRWFIPNVLDFIYLFFVPIWYLKKPYIIWSYNTLIGIIVSVSSAVSKVFLNSSRTNRNRTLSIKLYNYSSWKNRRVRLIFVFFGKNTNRIRKNANRIRKTPIVIRPIVLVLPSIFANRIKMIGYRYLYVFRCISVFDLTGERTPKRYHRETSELNNWRATSQTYSFFFVE